MGNKTNISIDISDKLIEQAIQKEVQVGIVRALGNPAQIVNEAVHTMTNKYVDDHGKLCERNAWNAKPYFDYLQNKQLLVV